MSEEVTGKINPVFLIMFILFASLKANCQFASSGLLNNYLCEVKKYVGNNNVATCTNTKLRCIRYTSVFSNPCDSVVHAQDSGCVSGSTNWGTYLEDLILLPDSNIFSCEGQYNVGELYKQDSMYLYLKNNTNNEYFEYRGRRISSPLAFNSAVLNETFNIYQDQRSGFLHIKSSSNLPCHIQLFSLHGQLIRKEYFVLEYKIDLSGIATGLYLYQITLNDILYTGKFIQK